MRCRRTGLLLLLSALVGLSTGCVLGFGDKAARQAELAGDYRRAYDLYVKSAGMNPSSRVLRLAIARVAPQAANYWEDQAHRAVDEGQYAEAWRKFMRVLEIRPDHPSAPHLIRRLERDHANEVEPLRAAWMKWGSSVLTSPGLRLASAGRSTAVTVPDGPFGQEEKMSSSLARPPALAAEETSSETRPMGSAKRPSVVSGTRAADAGGEARAMPPSKVAEPAGVGHLRLPTARASAEGSATTPNRTAGPTTHPAVSLHRDSRQAMAGGGGTPTTRTSSGGDRGRETIRALRRPSEPGQSRWGQYLVIRTLSKKDRRYPRKVEVIDGLTVEVRDTDDDPDADYNVYLAGKRIGKYKGVKIGEPRPVAGRSGRMYEIVLLSIIDSRRTIRFGIRPLAYRSGRTGKRRST